MRGRTELIVGLALFLVLLVLQLVSYRHLGREFTGEPGAVGEGEFLGELRIRMDRDELVGYIAGSVLGLVGLAGLTRLRRGPAFDALVWALIPTVLAGVSWVFWAFVNFGRADYLEASPVGGIIGLNGILAGFVCPAVCGCILAKDRPEETTIPERVRQAVGVFAGAVFLWTGIFVLTMFKYSFAV